MGWLVWFALEGFAYQAKFAAVTNGAAAAKRGKGLWWEGVGEGLGILRHPP
jgi:hypothetical protein